MILIAEIGLNHHGDFEKAKRLCSKAVEAGATLIKGQYYDPVKTLGADHPELIYATQCQFTRTQHEALHKYCESLGVPYSVSVFSIKDVRWVDSFGAFHKIASRMNKDRQFIAGIDGCHKPTYMSVQPDVDGRLPKRFNLLWCVRKYPANAEDILSYPYSKHFGLSSHCPDINATIQAIKKGARVVEHHVCESREEKGCDIPASITFEELRDISKALETL